MLTQMFVYHNHSETVCTSFVDADDESCLTLREIVVLIYFEVCAKVSSEDAVPMGFFCN